MGCAGEEDRKISISHRLRKHALRSCSALVIAGSEIVDKEEELIALDGAAELPPNCACEYGLIGIAGLVIILPGVGVQAIVLHVAVGRAMELIGAAFEHADNAAAIHVAVMAGEFAVSTFISCKDSGAGL